MIRQGHSRRKHTQLLDWDHDEMTALLLRRRRDDLTTDAKVTLRWRRQGHRDEQRPAMAKSFLWLGRNPAHRPTR